jgi:cytidylate kinase
MDISIADEELGVKADKKLVEKISKEIVASWNLKGGFSKNPMILLIGGFQGSGKTTVLNILRKKIDLIVISPDEIRDGLFARKILFNEAFTHTVNAIRNNLLKTVLPLRHNVAIDQLTTLTRINIAKEIVEKEGKGKYKFFTVFLKASEKTLEQRLGTRKKLQGTYRGTVSELKASVEKYGMQDLSFYDLVLDSEKMQPEKIVQEIDRKFNLFANYSFK